MGAPLLLLLLYVISLLSALPAGAADLASEREALLALRAAVGRSALPKWNASASPCSWPRVACKSGRVTQLHLPGVRLIGQIPPGILGNLTALQLLSLGSNAISGPLPSDLASCTDLRSLSLQGNRFSGDIPDSLFQLRNLRRLDLAGNQFSGGIPAGFNNLTRLAKLYLESNRLSGELPDLNLPALTGFNVSNNALNGSIPARLGAMPADAFLNTSLCGTPLAPCPVEPAGDKSSKLSGVAIAGIAVGSAVVFLILMILAVVLCQRRRASSAELSAAKRPESVPVPKPNEVAAPGVGAAVDHGKGLVFLESGPRGFDLEQLLRASAEVMGQGTFGMSYKTVLDNGMVLAVKRLKNVAAQETEFRETMEVIGAMRHSNLLSLKAYFYSRDEKLLVYDYMSMGSLSALLHGSKGPSGTPLDWEARAAIALSVARGLTYIHSTSPTASHGNIKSSNVILSRSYDDIRICDHGLTQLVGSSSIPNRANGYRAPEVTDVRKVSQKADVFSFGVLLMELLTGKSPQHAILDEGIDLPRWVQSVVREQRAIELFELGLLRHPGVEEEMMMMLQLAQDCTTNYPDQRPSMLEVVARVEEIHRSTLASAEGDRQQQSN